MLSLKQLSIIGMALEELIDRHSLSKAGTASELLRAIQAERKYQESISPLFAEHDRILSSPNLSPADEERLSEINRELCELSNDRPSEFGERYSADDAAAMGIVRAVAKAFEPLRKTPCHAQG